MIINLDAKYNGGLGDVVWLSWLGEGSKSTSDPIAFFTKDAQKRLLLAMLGQVHSHDERNAIDTSVAYQGELDDFGTQPRYRYVLNWIKRDDIMPARPRAEIAVEDMVWASTVIQHEKGKKKFVLLFPQTKSVPRQWPIAYWLDLAHELHKQGYFVAASFTGTQPYEHRWPAYIQDAPIERMAALMKHADLVIGNDSFPVHLSSTLGVETVVLAGPTKGEVVFGHMGENAPIVLTSDLWCTGCSWQQPTYRHACFDQCQSLMRLTPDMVLTAVCDKLRLVA